MADNTAEFAQFVIDQSRDATWQIPGDVFR